MPARQTSACSRASAAAVVGIGAVADDVAQAPDRLGRAGARRRRAPPRRRGGCRGCRRRWRPAWDLAAGLGRGAFFTNVERPRRVAVAVVAAFVVAEAAVLLLRPRDGVIAPVPVDARIVLHAGPAGSRSRLPPRPARALRREHARSRSALLVWLVRRPPARLRGPFRRPVLVAAGAGAALSVGLAVGRAPGRRDQPPALGRRRALDPGLGAVAGRRGQVDGDRRGLRRGRRRGRARAHAPLPAPLVDPRAARWPSASRRSASTWGRSCWTRSSTASRRCPTGARAPTCWRWRARRASTSAQVYEVDASRRTTGLQRLRHRARAHEARRPLRQPAQGLQPRRGAARRRPRARPRPLPRRAARPALRRARGAGGAVRRLTADARAWRPTSPGPGRPRSRRWRCRSRS